MLTTIKVECGIDNLAGRAMLADMHQPLDELLIDLEGSYPMRSLAAVRGLHAWLADAEARAVGRARADGISWGVIARTLGLSRAGLQKRYAGREDELRPRPNPLLDRELLLRWFCEPAPRPPFAEWAAEELGFFRELGH